MIRKITEYSTTLWISARETYEWATRPGSCWPCSELRGKRVMVCFDSRGNLVDLTINGQYHDCDANELGAIVHDFAPEIAEWAAMAQ